jgi:protein tyrosine/serine phosphatase
MQQKTISRAEKLLSAPIKAIIILIFAICLIQLLRETTLLSEGLNRDAQNQSVFDPNWAERIELPGLLNFYKVSEYLYRGGQPTKEGFKQLEKRGIKTIINLRANHTDKDDIADCNFLYLDIPVKAWRPRDKQIIQFLQIVTDKTKQPVFVHCQHGSDRTGLVCAAYRIFAEGWSKQQAVEEMTKGPYGFHRIWKNLARYIERLNAAKIQQIIKKQEETKTRSVDILSY